MFSNELIFNNYAFKKYYDHSFFIYIPNIPIPCKNGCIIGEILNALFIICSNKNIKEFRKILKSKDFKKLFRDNDENCILSTNFIEYVMEPREFAMIPRQKSISLIEYCILKNLDEFIIELLLLDRYDKKMNKLHLTKVYGDNKIYQKFEKYIVKYQERDHFENWLGRYIKDEIYDKTYYLKRFYLKFKQNWSIENHYEFNQNFKNQIKLVLLINDRTNTGFSKIPKEVLIYDIFKYFGYYHFHQKNTFFKKVKRGTKETSKLVFNQILKLILSFIFVECYNCIIIFAVIFLILFYSGFMWFVHFEYTNIPTCIDNCSNHGSCLDTNICSCECMWTGPQCDIYKLPHSNCGYSCYWDYHLRISGKGMIFENCTIKYINSLEIFKNYFKIIKKKYLNFEQSIWNIWIFFGNLSPMNCANILITYCKIVFEGIKELIIILHHNLEIWKDILNDFSILDDCEHMYRVAFENNFPKVSQYFRYCEGYFPELFE